MKKIFTLLCGLVVACTMHASKIQFTVDNITYEAESPYNSGDNVIREATVKGSTKSYLTIPATVSYAGYSFRVYKIEEDAFASNTSLTSLTIDATYLEEIGAYAFMGCTALESITFRNGNNRLKIKEQAFYGCTKVTGVGLPQMRQLCNAAFGGCTNLTSVLFNDIEILSQGAFYQCSKLNRIVWDNTKTVKITKSGSGLDNQTYDVTSTQNTAPFYQLRNQIKYVTIGGNVQDYMFQYMSVLEEVEMYSTLNIIGKYAFAGCTQLTKLDYFVAAPNLTKIDDYAFYNCPIANELHFYNNKLAYIGTQAFLNNHAPKIWMSTCDEQNGVEVGMDAFSSAYTKHIGILCKVKSLAYKAFRCSAADTIQYRPQNGYTTNSVNATPFVGCTNVSYLYVRSSGDIGAYLFYDCTNLRKVELDCANVAGTAFNNCSNIEEVIWDAATEYDYTALENPFKASHKITKVEFYGTRIPAFLFSNQTSLKKFTVGSAVTEIGNSAFLGAGLQYLTINAGDGTLNIRNNAFKNNSSLRIINCAYTTPPTLGDEVFLGCNEDLTNIDLLIPQEAESLYRVAKGWKDFFAPSEDIEEVMSNETLEGTRKVLMDGKVYIRRNDRLYDLNGTQVR